MIQLLRRHGHAVSGADIARELGISLRSLYRDVATLQAQGAPIEGARGRGYVLRVGFTLPPLMFCVDEIEGLVLGTWWVVDAVPPASGVWPFALGCFDRARVLVAWCELPKAIRHFRCDRILALADLEQRYPQWRQALLTMWRQVPGIAER